MLSYLVLFLWEVSKSHLLFVRERWGLNYSSEAKTTSELPWLTSVYALDFGFFLM